MTIAPRNTASLLAAAVLAAAPALAVAAPTWSAPAAVPGAPPAGAPPALALTPAGGAAALYALRGATPRLVEIARTPAPGRPWRAVRRLPAGAKRVTPRVLVDASGAAVAVWADGTSLVAAVRASATSAFGTPQVLVQGPTRAPFWDVAMGPDGTAAVAWQAGRAVEVALRAAGTATFGVPSGVTTTAQSGDRPAVAALPGGRALVAWVPGGRAGVDSAVIGGTAPVPLPRIPGEGATYPVAAAEDDEGATVAFETSVDDFQTVLASRLSGTSWSAPVTLQEMSEAVAGVGLGGAGVAAGTAFVFTPYVSAEPGQPTIPSLSVLAAGARGPSQVDGTFAYESRPLVAMTGSAAVMGWFEQGEPGITTAPRQRVARVRVVPATGPAGRTVTLGGNQRTEIRGLAGSFTGHAAAVLVGPASRSGRGSAVVRVSLMRP